MRAILAARNSKEITQAQADELILKEDMLLRQCRRRTSKGVYFVSCNCRLMTHLFPMETGESVKEVLRHLLIWRANAPQKNAVFFYDMADALLATAARVIEDEEEWVKFTEMLCR